MVSVAAWFWVFMPMATEFDAFGPAAWDSWFLAQAGSHKSEETR
jgi:hypothetical protein